ncbi:hypothetical protein GOP47_0019898 [Adiantum capillus-veneris]|uniref:Uncharacterized protein n=1 Tax=Adiantum capillus-veneris TaxID=13818 RepID=A0A9D4UBY1_ADICA|nr:hypothetical protein GOP47_0019898 [Adiantum capillus-veneris]
MLQLHNDFLYSCRRLPHPHSACFGPLRSPELDDPALWIAPIFGVAAAAAIVIYTWLAAASPTEPTSQYEKRREESKTTVKGRSEN